MNLTEQGCIDIWIDEIVPCLKDTETGEVLETVVFKIESRAYLKKFREDNGWHINWNEIPADVEVYALALKDNNEIQGLVGVRNDVNSNAAYLHWACTAPHNNKHDFGTQKYIGVGGHLFAIAADKSIQWGYEGAMHGFAANQNCWRYIIMNGIKPVFLNGTNLSPSYYETPNPYKNAPSCNVNLLQLSRYAKKSKKKLAELTKEEVQMFAIS